MKFFISNLSPLPPIGTGAVLKIQSLLHVCSEYYKSKDEEDEETEEEPSKEMTATGADEATPTSKEGEPVPTSEKTSTTTKGEKKKEKKSGKDVEMKDAEFQEPGSLGEPGGHQAISVLGIALIAMGDDIGAEMALRTFNHLVSVCVCDWIMNTVSWEIHVLTIVIFCRFRNKMQYN